MKFFSSYPLARIYLFLLSGVRAFLLGFGIARDYSYYLPHLDIDIFMFFFAVLFLFHWIIVMFYQSISKWVVLGAFALNLLYTLFCRLYFIADAQLSILEIAWYGSWLTVVIDLILIGIALYILNTDKKIHLNII
jgi:hypothetical protein